MLILKLSDFLQSVRNRVVHSVWIGVMIMVMLMKLGMMVVGSLM